MSMPSAQCDRLRKCADALQDAIDSLNLGRITYEGLTDAMHYGINDLRYAADTIWELRNKLCDMVDQRLEVDRLKAENAKLSTQLTDVTESMGRVEERCAKLRELAQDFDKCLDTALCLAHGAGYPVMPDQKLFDSLRPRMRDLGIEVQR